MLGLQLGGLAEILLTETDGQGPGQAKMFWSKVSCMLYVARGCWEYDIKDWQMLDTLIRKINTWKNPGDGLEGWRAEGALDDHLLSPGILFRADRGSPDCEGGGEAEDLRQEEPDSILNNIGLYIFIILSLDHKCFSVMFLLNHF